MDGFKTKVVYGARGGLITISSALKGNVFLRVNDSAFNSTASIPLNDKEIRRLIKMLTQALDV